MTPMGTVKCKTEAIQAAKIVLLIYFSLVILSAQSQQISGKYLFTDGAGLLSTQLNFSGKRFSAKVYTDTDAKIGSGYYVQDGKKLILFYEKIAIQDSSYFIIKKQDDIKSQACIISLRIFNEKNHLFKDPWVYLKGFHTNLQIITDSLGATNLVFWQNQFIDEIFITFLGYQSLSIPIKNLMGKSTDLECHLMIPQFYPLKEGREEYIIISQNKEELLLSHNGMEIRWTRIP